MKVTVINGTELKGCTYLIKEDFLKELKKRAEIEVNEFYLPKDCPEFCCGCKTCFFHDLDRCPHSRYILPIWNSIEESDLIVFSTPTYVFHTTGQMKALLDHYGTRWMPHRPREAMFSKQAVILSNAIGAGMKRAAKDIKDSLEFWGTARVYTLCQGLGEIKYDKINPKVKVKLLKKLSATADRVVRSYDGHIKPSIKIKIIFFVIRKAQKDIYRTLQKKGEDSIDYRYWKENGWLEGKKPW